MADNNSKQIALGLIAFCNEHGDVLTNLKLQKLVYYAQAWSLALRDIPLFDDRIEAWVHGPVQPSLYHEFKEFGSKPITHNGSAEGISFGVKKHLADVLRAYGRFSAFDLEQLTHSEEPWVKARGGLPPDEPCTNEIEKEDMRRFYRGKLNGEAQ